MLESIRKRRNSIVILVAFAAIIIVFIFWGAGPSSNDNANKTAVAVVDGQEIPVREYAALYKKEVEYYKNTFKDQFTDEVARKLDLKKRALDILVNRALALSEAKSKGVKISPEEVQEAIRSIKAFSTNGAFDKELYFKLLSSNRISPTEFEKSVEQDLATAKVRELVVKDVKVTDEDIKAAYRKDNRKIDLDYISFDGEAFKGSIKVTDDEAKEYLKKTGSAFMAPVKMKVAYAYADYASLVSKVKVTEAEVKEYYDKNQKEFETPERVKARHILIRPDEKAADKEKARADARKKLEEILKKVKGGAKFAELAKANSEDPGSARQGGDLDWFQKGVMIKPFEDAAFSLKKGEVSSIIETEFGYHIIMVEDKKEAGARPLKEVAAPIKKALSIEKSRTLARDSILAIQAGLKDAKTIEDARKAASAQKDLKFVVTESFSENDRRVEILNNEMLRDVIFGLRANEVTAPVDTNEGVYIIKAVEKIDAHVPEYSEVSAKVKARLVAERAEDEARKKADEVLKRLKAGEDFAAVAKAEKLPVGSTGLFSKAQGMIPRIGAFSGDKEQIFDLTSAAPVYAEVLNHNKKYFVLKLKNSKEADEANFEPMKELLRARITAEKQEEAVGAWLKDLKAKAKIKVYEDML